MQPHSDINDSHNKILRKVTISALIILVLFALWTSIHETFAIWNVNADTVDMVLLFHGLLHHGIQFLTTWRYTEDNWLLSVGPISFVIYYLFGANAITIIAPGWFVLVFNACVGGYILKLLLKNYIYPSLIFLLACLLPSIGSMGGDGFMTFLLSHNSTMSIVLVSFSCLLMVFKRNQATFINIWMLLLSLSVFVGGLSDPWFNAAFTLPAIVSLTIIAVSKKYRRHVCISLLYIIIGLILSTTRVFGLLYFLPSTNYVFVKSITQFYLNIHFLIRSLLVFANAHELLRINHLLGCVYILGLIYAAMNAIYYLAVKHKFRTIVENLFVYFTFLSILVMVCAFVFSNFPGGNYSARYLVNIFYFIFIIVIYAYSIKYDGKIYKMAVPLLLFALYAASSLYQGVPYWTKVPLNQKNSTSISLINFLEGHGLHYGYGGYWSSDANAISVLSDYHVFIRPVSYEPIHVKGSNPNFPFTYIVGNHAQSSPFWYHHVDTDKYNNSFLIIAHGGGLPELYNNSISSSEKIATEQFGEPYKTYDFKNEKILVWDKKINASVYGERSARYDKVIEDLSSAYRCLLSKDIDQNPYPLLAEKYGCLNSYYGGFKKNKSNFNWTAKGPSSWLGYQGSNKIGVGINIDFENPVQTNKYLNHIFYKYGKISTIYFPYPKKVNRQSHINSINGFLMIKFNR
ncbi:hypothetical protein [Acidithiobacillus caldus]|jgi:hypothetical protein|uniref:hypothetical protein n=1 Tax=Acidithiobacillus caldus TaxID=33059 RepID=UPI00114CCEA4|nr:hypothetical protein [Acidithiobacillus caldus]